jgi:hypothetical protein
MENKITIVITTFKYRFEKYLKNLVNQIKSCDNDVEVIVCINGENKESFDETYRKDILTFLADKKNVYPVFFPEFRSLSLLWNTGIRQSSNNFILILNDDLSITDKNFLNNVKSCIGREGKSFKINGSFSHFLVNKLEVFDVGGFNTKLLGIGEEDGFFEWMYNYKLKRSLNNFYIPGIINHVEMSHNPTNTRVISQGKYSKYNQEVFYNVLFTVDNINGKQMGICPAKLILNENLLVDEFPNERYYLENKHKL